LAKPKVSTTKFQDLTSNSHIVVIAERTDITFGEELIPQSVRQLVSFNLMGVN
jgi:hypothetical protein